MCVRADKATVTPSTTSSAMSVNLTRSSTGTSTGTALLLFLRASRSPINGVKTVLEFVRGCELPFTDDSPDDNRSSHASCYDDDSDDRVTREVASATARCARGASSVAGRGGCLVLGGYDGRGGDDDCVRGGRTGRGSGG